MTNNFEYYYTKSAMGEITVDDVGDCAIEACNDDGLVWYLIIDTSLGNSRIFEYGPIMIDLEELPKSVTCKFDRIEFDERKINKRITEFLNSPYKNITQATVVPKEIALDSCIDIIDYMRGDRF